jgi:hypothetical protein
MQLRIGCQDHQGRGRGKGARTCASERGRASLLPRVMPRPKRDPYYYRRKGRKGFFAFIDSEHKHIPTTWSLRTFLEQVVMDVADELSRQDARITALEERATVDDTSLHEWQER